MNTRRKLSELKRLQAKVDSIRNDLRIGSPGEVLALYSVDGLADDRILVEADGFGGATTRIVEGNYPVDYITKYEKHFRSENDAEFAAENLFKGDASPHDNET